MPIPPADYPTIIQNTDWDWNHLVIDDETLEDFDWTNGTWQVAAELRDGNDTLHARLSNYGSPDGTITLTTGLATYHLPAAWTGGIPATRTYIGSSDPRLNGWRHRGTYAFDAIATELVSGVVVPLVSGFVTVQQNVTV